MICGTSKLLKRFLNSNTVWLSSFFISKCWKSSSKFHWGFYTIEEIAAEVGQTIAFIKADSSPQGQHNWLNSELTYTRGPDVVPLFRDTCDLIQHCSSTELYSRDADELEVERDLVEDICSRLRHHH